MKDVMLDLETMGTQHDAMIVSIGACYFDRNTGEIGETFFRNVHPGEYADKFSYELDTIKWWLKQSEEARNILTHSSMPIDEALSELKAWLWASDLMLWSHATFDMPILANAFWKTGIKMPVPFRNMRDLRTLMDIADHHSGVTRIGVHHHALDDAKFQARYAAEAFRKLYGRND